MVVVLNKISNGIATHIVSQTKPAVAGLSPPRISVYRKYISAPPTNATCLYGKYQQPRGYPRTACTSGGGHTYNVKR